MRTIIALLSAALWLAPVPHSDAGETPRQKAERILNEVDDLWRGESSRGAMTMTVRTRNYTRSIKMEAWSKGKDYSLVRIVLPLKEKGTATLKSKQEIYTYLPQTDRTIRLTSGMMMGSWMGSHFTNDDLVKESRLLDDYFAEVTFEGRRDGGDVIDFTLTPKPDSAVVWGKIVVTVVDERIPVKEVFYDEDMNEARTMTFTDIRDFSGRKIPAIMHMVPADKPDEYTEIRYESLNFNLKLDGAFFSISSLKKR